MLPGAINDEPETTDGFRESFARRNGRRQSPDVDLYIPELKSRTR
jgi:hypothetical protein